MIYFEKHRDNSVSKWDVEFDIEDLESIRETVKKECGTAIHHVHDVPLEIAESRENNSNYHNFTKTKIEGDTYRVSYDEYEYPRLVELIGKLLNGDLTVLPEIENPIETGQKRYTDKIASIDDEIDTIDNFDIEKKIRKLEELRAAIRESNNNKSEKKLSKYYEMVQSVISMHLISHLDSDEVEKLEDFFDVSVDTVIKRKQKSIMIDLY